MCGGEIFVPKLKSYNIIQLCNVINPDAEIEITGLRPGEKLHECMINSIEINDCYECDNYYVIFCKTILNIDSKFNDYLLNYKLENIKKYTANDEYISGKDMLTDNELKNLINT